MVSFGTPENRLSYFEGDYGWTTTTHSIPKPSVDAEGMPKIANDPSQQHYIYIATKVAPA